MLGKKFVPLHPNSSAAPKSRVCSISKVAWKGRSDGHFMPTCPWGNEGVDSH
jgi:hypothetical protein